MDMPDYDIRSSIVSEDDVELVAEWLLVALADVEPEVPRDLVEMAGSLYSWRNPDAALAQLVYDSALEDALAVRDDNSGRMLTFESSDTSLIVDIEANTATGQIYPVGTYRVELHQPPTVRSTMSNPSGMFTFDAVGPGSTRIVVYSADDVLLVAGEWTVVIGEAD